MGVARLGCGVGPHHISIQSRAIHCRIIEDYFVTLCWGDEAKCYVQVQKLCLRTVANPAQERLQRTRALAYPQPSLRANTAYETMGMGDPGIADQPTHPKTLNDA